MYCGVCLITEMTVKVNLPESFVLLNSIGDVYYAVISKIIAINLDDFENLVLNDCF